MGRPKKLIDRISFEKLCFLQCTLEEIAAFFDCSPDTIERWCKREYRKGFADVFAQKRQAGKISLRRAQFRLAERSATMAIFMGKQYLGQREDSRPADERREDPLSESLRDLAKELEHDDQ